MCQMNRSNQDRILGSILGLALGDAFGAPYEGGPLERVLWAIIGKTGGKKRWTDDTQMSMAVAEVLVEKGCIDQAALAQRFAKSYRWSRGYGPGAARVLSRIRQGEPWETACTAVFPSGSYGNGGAMRAPVVGLFYAYRGNLLVDEAMRQAIVTHSHPLGIEGAILVALATAEAIRGEDTNLILAKLYQHATSQEFQSRLALATQWLAQGVNAPPVQVARELGNGIAAHKSCVTAIYLALAFRASGFENMLRFACRLGGDVDTISAMAGAIWGAAHGVSALPESWLVQLEQRDVLTSIANSLASAAANIAR